MSPKPRKAAHLATVNQKMGKLQDRNPLANGGETCYTMCSCCRYCMAVAMVNTTGYKHMNYSRRSFLGVATAFGALAGSRRLFAAWPLKLSPTREGGVSDVLKISRVKIDVGAYTQSARTLAVNRSYSGGNNKWVTLNTAASLNEGEGYLLCPGTCFDGWHS